MKTIPSVPVGLPFLIREDVYYDPIGLKMCGLLLKLGVECFRRFYLSFTEFLSFPEFDISINIFCIYVKKH